jgi:23S rRNA (pseudouridine1915-N3)-methyltransferase
MKIECWSIGKTHDEYVNKGVEDFTARIRHYFPIEWLLLAPKKINNGNPEKWKAQEAELILAALRPEDYLVALHEKGKSLSSPELARFIQDRGNESIKRLVFLIGGAYGLDKTVLARAKFQLSLSALTFPHQLVRLIVAEQIYRACSILRNEKYHHG